MRPGMAALSGKMGLAAALEQAFKQLGQQRSMGDLLGVLEADSEGLPPLLNQIQVLAMQRLVGEAKPQIERPPTLVLALDQAEELFVFDAGQEAAKIRRHLAAALTRGPDTICLLTIRSDRFSLLQNDDQLKKLLEPFNLPPIDPTVYREAILQPAARTTPPITIDVMLSEALIKDTAAEGADPLPLLAFTLERLYRRYGRTLHKMEPAHYEALGGITGLINEAIMEAFSSPDRNPSIPADRKERERLLEAAFIPALVDINHTYSATRLAGSRSNRRSLRSAATSSPAWSTPGCWSATRGPPTPMERGRRPIAWPTRRCCAVGIGSRACSTGRRGSSALHNSSSARPPRGTKPNEQVSGSTYAGFGSKRPSMLQDVTDSRNGSKVYLPHTLPPAIDWIMRQCLSTGAP